VITADFIQRAGFSALLGFRTPSAVEHIFNELEGRSVLEQRRTVPPFQLVRRWDSPLDLLKRAYGDGRSL
jgi:hypothetical protein